MESEYWSVCRRIEERPAWVIDVNKGGKQRIYLSSTLGIDNLLSFNHDTYISAKVTKL